MVDTHAGQAWVDLLVRLGHAPGPQQHQPHQPGLQKLSKVRNGPSRQRRRARRNAASLQKEESEIIREEAEEVPNASKKDTENVDASVVQAEADKLEESEIKKTFIEINDDGGLSGGSSVRRPGSEDPHRRQRKFETFWRVRLEKVRKAANCMYLVCRNFTDNFGDFLSVRDIFTIVYC